MNKFADSVTFAGSQEQILTENGAVTNKTSESALVDLFFRIGAARSQNLNSDFSRAFGEDSSLALRMLLWARDIRGGVGERETVRQLLRYLEQVTPAAVLRILPNIPVVGRWDDLLVFNTKQIKDQAYALIVIALDNQQTQGLVAKWMPRKGPVAVELTKFMGITPRRYRKLLVSMSNTVEQKMCSKDWESINFEHVPSVAMSRYTKAFWKHAKDRMEAYINAVKEGKAKINANAAQPHEIIRGLNNNENPEIANLQWKALDDVIDTDVSFLPMCDVSGSMDSSVSGSVTALDICVGLGVYLSERNKSAFKDIIMTFSGRPEMIRHTGTLSERMEMIKGANWQMNTNLEAAFVSILDHAMKNHVLQSEMPGTLLVLSDMEFDSCTDRPGLSLYDNLKVQYEQVGYRLPKVVFWNINSRNKNNPVTVRDSRTALISGYSPVIVKTVLGNEIDPYKSMISTLMVDRYTPIGE